ncbi:plasmid pRiA4b ORF-3 family protein [Clostridium boliviensis]|uniref:Plasmid pRiA4b ORF-3 family protein n=1 Tax=Clostridium boliviensis TaxID=318465 RepID=A0ABU4GLR8_9CLOT|nr:plasmid pRiA4b ORF-3 family protein [Clostridium boliviensis]MDW2797893.1 plasmid pRiA4b ORF-3 family protein [Clostridium boliviensis]
MGAYQLKITIKGSKPPIWRRILVPEGITFETLHHMIQASLCWSGQYPYQFEFRSEKVRVASDKVEHSEKYKYLPADGTIDGQISKDTKFTYVSFNAGSWEFVVLTEDYLEECQDNSAKVIKYKGDIIPESCSSLEEYAGLIEVSAVKGLEYDMDAVNLRLDQMAEDSGEVHISDVFDCYDRNSILEIAKRHHMNGTSKLKKEELVQKTISYILDEKIMKPYFLCVRDCEIEAFEKIMSGSGQLNQLESESMDYIYAGGYVTSGANHCFLISEEVIKAYKAINTAEFQAERSRLSRIGDYLCAANSLYAITPPSVVLETFNKYEEKKLTLEELLSAYECLRPYRCMVTYIDGNFADAALSSEQKGYTTLLRTQKKVPYYIPTEQEIRFMSDNSGFLMNEQLYRLNQFLTSELSVPDEMIPLILRQVQAELSLGGQLQDVINDLEAAGVLLETPEHMEMFASIITDTWNHTRMVQNRGHKPYEMVMKGLEDVSAQRKNIQKIYPNDACPCGSGKKYKKCCGKNA